MLSRSSTTPRRPLPPAKARKSTTLNFSIAPPPYAPPGHLDDVLLDSPIGVTAQLINAASSRTEDIGLPGTPGIEEWMNEKSREELSGLLLKADGIIKSRETELGLTSALCKSLYSDNVTLKTKHEALLARLPGTRTSTPTTSRPSSPFRLDAPALEQSPLQSPSYFSSVTFPASPTGPPSRLAIPTHLRRTRRISVTPGELALLSDQNAELLEKLEMLEAESVKADEAGKRKLRKLEQEIQTLRDELERTHTREAELEQQARAAANAVTAQKRKEEREAKLQALKERSISGSSAGGSSVDEVRDFAPPNELAWPRTRTSPVRRTFSGSSALSSSAVTARESDQPAEGALGLESLHEDGQLDEGSDSESYFPPPTDADGDAVPPAEYAIVSQLLSKIRELEETNAQIKEEQKMTEERMRAARWDAESIRRVYDCLDDEDVDLAIEEEDNGLTVASQDARLAVPSTGTIRFSSLRRSIAGDMNKLLASEADVFADGIAGDMRSTVRDALMRGSTLPKARKTVVGLFDAAGGSKSPEYGQYPPSLKVSPAFRSLDADTSVWSTSATDGIAPASPALSTLQTPVDGLGLGRSLGSELGSEFGDDWAGHGINHHLRATSLADLAGLYSSPVSPSESVSILPPINLHPAEEQREDPLGPEPSTPPRVIPNLQLQPPTPTPEKLRSATAATVRQQKLSQTVRARTNRWVEGRFQHSPSTSTSLQQQESQALRKRNSVSNPGRRPAASIFGQGGPGGVLGETFDSAVGQIRRVASRSGFATLVPALEVQQQDEQEHEHEQRHEEENVNAEADRSLSLRQEGSVADPFSGKRDGFVGFVLEAWLWLQFIIVVALFLWAMAKRGPKVVLEAERRNANRAAAPRS